MDVKNYWVCSLNKWNIILDKLDNNERFVSYKGFVDLDVVEDCGYCLRNKEMVQNTVAATLIDSICNTCYLRNTIVNVGHTIVNVGRGKAPVCANQNTLLPTPIFWRFHREMVFKEPNFSNAKEYALIIRNIINSNPYRLMI